MSIIGREYFYDDEQYVIDLFNSAREDTNHLYDIKTAREDLEYYQNEWNDVPESLTAEGLMTMWNELACAHSEYVVLPNGRRVPRCSEMTDKQIAEVIHYANDWSKVEDLVKYLDERYLDLKRDEYYGCLEDGWDYIVEEWCEKNM